MQRHSPRQSNHQLALLIALALTAVAGWGLFIVSSWSAAEFEEHLRNQVSSLHQKQMELLNERAQRESETGTLEQLRAQVAALRNEHRSLTQARDQAQAELNAARAGMSGEAGQDSQSGGNRADAEATGTVAGGSQHLIVVAAQNILTKLGYGPLEADGLIGPSTRQALERFQQDNGLTVTGDLDSTTLRLLTTSNRVATRQ